MNELNEKELIARLKNAEPAALEQAIQQYGGYVMAVLSKVLGTNAAREDKDELLTDVFIALWKSRGMLREEGKLKFWLAVVARNAAFGFLRKMRLTLPLEENRLSDEEADLFFATERRERIQTVRMAVGTLSEEDQDIFLRHYFWKQTVSRISDETGINESTIKSRLSRGRKKLKAFLIREDCTL